MKNLEAAKREAQARNKGTLKLASGRVWVVAEKRGNWVVVPVYVHTK
jgi:hypothetical protein